jgi:ethanolamine utilization protein EutN
MLKATVTGRIWSTKKVAEVPPGSILEVATDESNTRLLAFDPLGCAEGEKVIVATGSVAAAWFPGKAPPIDALIIGSIDESATNPNANKSRRRT